MKNLVILLFLLPTTVQAQRCNNPISRTAAEIAIEKAQVNPEVEFPRDFRCNAQSECLCYDGVEWGAAEIVPNMIDTNPIYDKTDSQKCSDICEDELGCQTECDLIVRALIEDETCKGDYRPTIYQGEAFCGLITGYEQIQDGHKIVNNETKLQQVKQARLEQEQREQARFNKIRNNKTYLRDVSKKIDQARNIQELKPILEKIVELLGVETSE